MNVDFRNGIVSSQPNYLTKSLGGTYTVSITTNTKDLILTVSHGISEYLISFYNDVNSAWTFNDADTHYLYVDVDNITGQLSYGSSTVQVTYGVDFPISPVVGETFFDHTTFQSYQWTGDSWVKRIRVYVGHVNGSGVVQNGVGNITGSSIPYVSGSIIYSGTGRGILKQDKTFLSVTDRVMINEVPFGASTIEQTAISVKAADTLAGGRFVKLNSQGYLTYANPVDVGNSLIFVLTESLGVGEVTFLPVGGVINNPSWNWNFADLPLWVGENGEISAVDPTSANPILPNKQPIGRTISTTGIVTNSLNFLGSVPEPETPPFEWNIVTSGTVAAQAFNGYVVQLSDLTFNINIDLPTSPSLNDEIVVTIGTSLTTTIAVCTVRRNGNLIQGEAINISIDLDHTTLRFVWVDGNVGWTMMVSFGGQLIPPLDEGN